MFKKNFYKNYNLCKNYKIIYMDGLLISLKFSCKEFLNCILFPIILDYKKKIKLLRDEYLRSRADLDNFKKRSNEDLNKSYKYAIEDFSENLLSVLDSLESALVDKSGNIEKLLEGLRLILKLLLNVFEKNNIKIIFPEINEKFDPYKHLAISLNKSIKENNTIFNVLQKGYSIYDRIIRPALVVVNKV